MIAESIKLKLQKLKKRCICFKRKEIEWIRNEKMSLVKIDYCFMQPWAAQANWAIWVRLINSLKWPLCSRLPKNRIYLYRIDRLVHPSVHSHLSLIKQNTKQNFLMIEFSTKIVKFIHLKLIKLLHHMTGFLLFQT